ncbi:hypothetical protein SLE2022_061800 [Rubroshorea leprosula]
MVTVDEVREAQRAKGPATVLAIGTATPPNCVLQSTYVDSYFRITNSEHMTELKEKFRRICERSNIEKRYMHFTEDIFNENPNICSYMEPSLSARQDILRVEVPKLGKEASVKAITEWGQSKSKITHLVLYTSFGRVEMPGADYELINLLGLHPSVKHVMICQVGCHAGGTILRLAKDIAENNKGARVLAVWLEFSDVASFHGPSESCLDNLVGQALFGDGAAAVVIGSDPIPEIEKPLFQLVSASQNILPESNGALTGRMQEAGLIFHLDKNIPKIVSNNIEKCLVEAFQPLDIIDWNSIFWILHPGGRAILDQVEVKLGLKPGKLRASRHTLAQYGNMWSASVLFVLDEMRKKSAENALKTTGEGLEWGVLVGFGPGMTLETVVLHSVAI